MVESTLRPARRHRSVTDLAAVALGTLLALTLPAALARAQPAAALEDTVQRYFDGERAQGYAWIGVGEASLVGGGALLAQDSGVLRGMSYPLLAVGLIQFLAGVSSLTRSDARAAAMRREIAADPAGVQAREGTRVRRLNFLFRVIRYTEFSLLGLGAAGAALGGALRQDQLLGAGIGLAVEAALMLTLDHFAERRAHRYAEGLGSISFAVDQRLATPALLLAFTRRF